MTNDFQMEKLKARIDRLERVLKALLVEYQRSRVGRDKRAYERVGEMLSRLTER
jgi:hypothetical protein